MSIAEEVRTVLLNEGEVYLAKEHTIVHIYLNVGWFWISVMEKTVKGKTWESIVEVVEYYLLSGFNLL